jgi:hypothetical protein
MPSPLLLLCLLARQPPTAKANSSRPFSIVDNSFLVEEAFNQEPKVVQNIFGWMRQQGNWQFSFTQEWPVPGKSHQLSYTIPVNSLDGSRGFGDVLLNYRHQVLEEGPGRPAFAPRLSVVLPVGTSDVGGGVGGLQVNLPFSKQQSDFYFHWNAGFTWSPSTAHPDLFSPALAGSAIYRLDDMCNLMLESVLSFVDGEVAPDRTKRVRWFTLSPGIRGGWNVGPGKQIVVGAAIPVSWTEGKTYGGIFGYFSYELPFRK